MSKQQESACKAQDTVSIGENQTLVRATLSCDLKHEVIIWLSSQGCQCFVQLSENVSILLG